MKQCWNGIVAQKPPYTHMWVCAPCMLTKTAIYVEWIGVSFWFRSNKKPHQSNYRLVKFYKWMFNLLNVWQKHWCEHRAHKKICDPPNEKVAREMSEMFEIIDWLCGRVGGWLAKRFMAADLRECNWLSFNFYSWEHYSCIDSEWITIRIR